MKYAKKMVLVDPRVLPKDALLPQQPQSQPQPGTPWEPPTTPTPTWADPDTAVSRTLQALDQEMQHVLSTSGLEMHDKVTMYNQVLRRYLVYGQQKLNPFRPASGLPTSVVNTDTATPDTDKSSDSIEREMLESVPKTMKSKARLLIQRLKEHPNLSWNAQGQMIYKDKVIPDTRMTDLLNDVLRRRKRFEPMGWKTFAKALKEINVPQDFIGHPERWAAINGGAVAEKATWPQDPGEEQTSTESSRSRPNRKQLRLQQQQKILSQWKPY